MIRFNCPACGKVLAVPEEAGGKVGKCPCGQMIQAPKSTVVPQFSPLEPEEVEEEKKPQRREILDFLSLIFGLLGWLFSALGCFIYLIIWARLEPVERLRVIYGQGPEIILLPKVMNYVSLPFLLAGMVLGILSCCLERKKGRGINGIILGSIGIVIVTAFWIWTISRDVDEIRKEVKKYTWNSRK
jgi:hypothetical protein